MRKLSFTIKTMKARSLSGREAWRLHSAHKPFAHVGSRSFLVVALTVGFLIGCRNATGPEPPKSNTPYTFSGFIYDASQPYGAEIGITGAVVSFGATQVPSDSRGLFELTVINDKDPLLTINAPGFHEYKERPSRMVNGGFHLIPEDVYRGVYLVVWDRQSNNPRNTLRTWDTQTEFLVVRQGASEEQINKLRSLLLSDEYRKMTGGRFSSSVPINLVDVKPTGSARDGKTVISFSPGIIPGGIAHSEDRSGVIYYGEITWDTNQVLGPAIVWHEMVHTLTTGGHINEWPSVVSEIQTTGYVTEMDRRIFNCIYNSPN